MLHPFRFYAYCYTLLCFLHQQQQAASLAIILDGATTNEWATRDEYQRLVEAAGQQQRTEGRELEGPRRPAGTLPGDGRPLQVQVPVALEGPIMELLQERRQEGEALEAVERLESALERLDLIEKNRQRTKLAEVALPVVVPSGSTQQQLNINRQLEQRHLSRGRNRPANSWQPQLAGARTLNDLVPVGDRSRADPLRQLKVRGSAPQVYCGQKLIDVLELVCHGRYYPGESRVLTVEPTIKSKRFKRGATAECCHRPCHLDELKPYCEP